MSFLFGIITTSLLYGCVAFFICYLIVSLLRQTVIWYSYKKSFYSNTYLMYNLAFLASATLIGLDALTPQQVVVWMGIATSHYLVYYVVARTISRAKPEPSLFRD